MLLMFVVFFPYFLYR